MPLPGGATGFSLTGGPYDDPAFQGMSAILTTNVPVTHLATGERLRKSWTVTVDYSGSFTVGPLPFSDDPAFTPNGFTYTLTWQALSYKDTPGNLTFAVPQSAGTTVDFDTLTSAGNGQPALPTAVFSVNGHTGAVTLTASDVGAAPAGSAGAVASVNSKTGAVILSASDVGADVGGAATAAQAFAVQRGNHTGTQSADTLTDGTTNKAYTATEQTKLAGVAAGATAYSDAQAQTANAAALATKAVIGDIPTAGTATGDALRAAFVPVENAAPNPQPVTVAAWTTVYSDTADAFSFPPRVLPPQTNRKRFVVRNRGTTPVWVGYSTGDESNYNKPADALFTVNGVINPGQEWVEGASEQAVFVRPTTTGNAVLVSVYVELGA